MRQQIYQVLPGRPFGRARHGSNVTISADPHTRRTATGTIGTNTLNLSAPAYSNGDVIVIHQTKNPASLIEENWELALIVSGGGTATLTLQDNLGRTYTSGAQTADLREYRNANIQNHTISAWNGSIGALWAYADAGETTGTGTINCAGLNGFPQNSDTSGSGGNVNTWRAIQPGGGFQGGWNSNDGSRAGAGEGNTVAFVTETANTGDNGGGGGNSDNGGGGGNANDGGNGSGDAIGGRATGNVELTSMFPGGGGGGTRASGSDGPSSGGNGGGMGLAWSKYWNGPRVNNNGANGGDSTNPPFGGSGVADGGGGAGGDFLGNFERSALGTNFITCDRGISPSYLSGWGSVGRIRINYGLEAPTGTTTPSASVAQNSFLVDPVGGSFLFF